MDIHSTHINTDLYVSAASDPKLSSSDNQLLTTLLSEEDQLDYNQLLNIQLSSQILQVITHVRKLLQWENHIHFNLSLFFR